jgi:tetratricopeptide (TPR) repeat protein
VADLDKAIDLEPLEPSYRCRRGLLWLRKEQLGRALADFDEAIRLDPDNAHFHYERARAYLYHDSEVRPENALPDLDEAIRLKPDARWYREDRGHIYFYLGYWAKAAEDFACQDIAYTYRLCPERGASPVIWLYLARMFQGEEPIGIEAVERYLDWYSTVAPAGPDALPFAERSDWPVPLARFLAGQTDERELLATPSLDLSKPDLLPYEEVEERVKEYHFVMAELLLSRGSRDESREHLKKARFLPARNPMSWVVDRQLSCQD